MPLRRLDYKSAQKVTHFIANSSEVQRRIKEFYGRESTVIHPPVDTARFTPEQDTGRKGLVIAGRQVPYKRFDLAVQAATALNLPLTVIGKGPEHDRLRLLAGPNVRFETNVSDQQMVEFFQKSAGFIFPGLEDFGITPVEAMAAGCPVIAYRGGGALDFMVENETGIFFDSQTPESLTLALKRFDSMSWNEQKIVAHAQAFSEPRFAKQLSGFVAKVLP